LCQGELQFPQKANAEEEMCSSHNSNKLLNGENTVLGINAKY